MVSYRRIYESTVKKYSAKQVLIGMALVFSMFYMMADRGDITILNYSEDTKCAGTNYEPCYAYLEFKANTDIYIYPTNSSTWAFQTRPKTAIKEIVMQRSWGKGYRTIDLSKPWSSKVKYAIKFHNDTIYKIRFVGYKHNINDTVKWGFGFDQGKPDKNTKEYQDPVWSGYNSEDYFIEITDMAVGLTKGYAVFTMTNPLPIPIDISNESLRSMFNVADGELINWNYEIESFSEERNITKTRSVCIDNITNMTVQRLDNTTNETIDVIEEVNTPICVDEDYDFVVPSSKSYNSLKSERLLFGQEINIRVDLEYTPQSNIDWIPTLDLEGVHYEHTPWLWFNSSFSNRKNFQINGTGLSNPDNYPKAFNISYESVMNSTFKDIRFTWLNISNTSQEVEIDYWVEENVSETNATVWVEIPSISNTTNTTLYMYYGNPTATSESNGTDTFDFFDNFEDNDVTDWSTEAGATIIAQNTVVEKGSYASRFINTVANKQAYKSFGSHATGIYDVDLRVDATDQIKYFLLEKTGNDLLNSIYLFFDLDGNIKYYDGSSYTLQSYSADTWYHFEIIFDAPNDKFTIYIDDTLKATDAGTRGSIASEITAVSMFGNNIYNYLYTDTHRLRKYTATEPTYSIGAEESANSAPSITANATSPSPVYTNTDWLTNVTVTDEQADTLTVYNQYYVNDTAVGGVISTVVTNNTNTLVATLGSGNFSVGDNLTSEFWAGDGTVNTSKANMTVTVSESVTEFIVILNSPANNTNTSDSTPDFNFTVNGTEDTYSCELFIYDKTTGFIEGDSFCIQETANDSTCGLNTGSYIDGASEYFYVNYTIPNYVENTSLWEVKHGSSDNTDETNPYFYNISMDNDCWNQDGKLQLRISSRDYISGFLYEESRPSCWDGNSWVNVGTNSVGTGGSHSVTSPYTAEAWRDANYGTHSIQYVGGYATCLTTANNRCYWKRIFDESMWWNYSSVSTINASVLNGTQTQIILDTNPLNDGTYDYVINCTNSIVESTETREITIDTTDPVITVISPTNTTYTPFVNITFNFTINEEITASTYSLDSGSWLSLTPGMNLTIGAGTHDVWFAVTDYASNWGYAQTYFTVSEGLIIYINSSSSSVFNELGHKTNITAISNDTDLKGTMCLSINHLDYGDDFYCNTSTYFAQADLNFTVNKINEFNDSTTEQNLSYSGVENQTVYVRSYTNNNLSYLLLNLTGVNAGGYPSYYKIYVNDTLTNSFTGTLQEGVKIEDEFNGLGTSAELNFSNTSSQTVYIDINKNAEVLNATFNFSGSDIWIYDSLFCTGSSDTTPAHRGFDFYNGYLYSTWDYTITNRLYKSNFGGECAEITYTDLGFLPGDAGDIHYDGSYFYIANRAWYQVFKYDTNMNYVSTITPTSLPGPNEGFKGLEWDGTNWWVIVYTTDIKFWLYKFSSTWAYINRVEISLTYQPNLESSGLIVQEEYDVFYYNTDNSYVAKANLTTGAFIENKYDLHDIYSASTWTSLIEREENKFYAGSFKKGVIANFTQHRLNNIFIDIEVDGSIEYQGTGELNESISPIALDDFASNINNYLIDCTANANGDCQIPIRVGTNTLGKATLNALNITYNININPITISASTLNDYIDEFTNEEVNIPIKIETEQGNITVNGLNYSFYGDFNYTVNATYKNASFDNNGSESNTLKTIWSDFIVSLPEMITDVFYFPLTNNDKYSIPFGQTSTVPIINLTGAGESQNISYAIYHTTPLNSCLNDTISNTNSYLAGSEINSTARTIINGTFNNSNSIYLWRNHTACSLSSMFIETDYTIKSCCQDCLACW